MEKILIVRLGAMGDVIHALPAVAMLRREYPSAELDWIVDPRWRDLISPQLANVLSADTKSWRKNWFRPGTMSHIAKIRRELGQRRYQLAIDFQGSIKSAVIAGWSNAPRVVGFRDPKERPAARFYHHKIDRLAPHVIAQNLGLVCQALQRSMPASNAADPPDLLPGAEDASQSATQSLPNSFAILNPTAGWAAKEWPAERYGELAKQLAKRGLESLINIGPGEREATLADVVERTSAGTARRIQCSIGQLIGVTRRASLFVGGDTGPMHLANALGIPVVAIFGPTDPVRNGPYYNPHIVLRNSLSQTSYSHVDRPDPGILSIGVDEVAEAAQQLLRQRS
jgi:heptosyltransferase-1